MRQKRIFSHRILADEKKCARGGSGEIHPPIGGSPLGGAHGQGVRTACPFRPVGRMGHTGRGPGWGGGGIVSTVGNFVHKCDNFAVVFGCKK